MNSAELEQRVAVLAERARRALAERDAAVRELHEAGASLRVIARATGLSPAGIARIVKRQGA